MYILSLKTTGAQDRKGYRCFQMLSPTRKYYTQDCNLKKDRQERNRDVEKKVERKIKRERERERERERRGGKKRE